MESTASLALIVEGELKAGHFSITFEDLSVPLAGLPITVTRTYDTRQRGRALDFGHGWSVDYQNIRIHESGRTGFGWQIYDEGGTFGQRCIRSNGDRIIAIRLPDGEIEKFVAKVLAGMPYGV